MRNLIYIFCLFIFVGCCTNKCLEQNDDQIRRPLLTKITELEEELDILKNPILDTLFSREYLLCYVIQPSYEDRFKNFWGKSILGIKTLNQEDNIPMFTIDIDSSYHRGDTILVQFVKKGNELIINDMQPFLPGEFEIFNSGLLEVDDLSSIHNHLVNGIHMFHDEKNHDNWHKRGHIRPAGKDGEFYIFNLNGTNELVYSRDFGSVQSSGQNVLYEVISTNNNKTIIRKIDWNHFPH